MNENAGSELYDFPVTSNIKEFPDVTAALILVVIRVPFEKSLPECIMLIARSLLLPFNSTKFILDVEFGSK
jgi:hypothetical protein